MARRLIRARSLRWRALLSLATVVVLAVAWVWLAGIYEAGRLHRVTASLGTAAAQVANGADPDAVARQMQAWVRVIEGDRVAVSTDHSVDHPWHQPVSEPFFGPGGRPDAATVDGGLGPLETRTEVRQALRDGHVQEVNARLILSLYEDRYPLTAFMLVVLSVGGFIAAWVGWRMVGPIEQLRDQVVDRTRGRVSTDPIALDRDDELGDLAGAFNQLLGALESRNRANEAFAADLAHELKNPVAAVRAAADALASDRPVEGARRERMTRILGDSAHRMQVVIDRFLDLARAEAGLRATEREPVALHTLLEAIAQSVRSDTRFAHLSIDVRVPPSTVLAAPERLETALRNLIGNASSYAESRVELIGQADEHRITLVVRDDGPGIPTADLGRIFRRYYTTRDTGTGLGLALVRAIVEAHAGSIEVFSIPGEGAVFTVTLPIHIPGTTHAEAG